MDIQTGGGRRRKVRMDTTDLVRKTAGVDPPTRLGDPVGAGQSAYRLENYLRDEKRITVNLVLNSPLPPLR